MVNIEHYCMYTYVVHQVCMTKVTPLINCNTVEIEEAMASKYIEINKTFFAPGQRTICCCSFLTFWHLTPP